MKFLKFVGWSAFGLLLLTSLVFWYLPTLASMAITQGLTSRGFENVSATLDYPNTTALRIRSLAFNTPTEFGSNSISIENTEITYSLGSLLNRMVEGVEIEHIAIIWDSSLLEKDSAQSPSSPTNQSDAPFDFSTFDSGIPFPILPFQHLHIKQADISNPLAPPALKKLSLNATIDALEEGYEGNIQFNSKELSLNSLFFSLTQQGTVAFRGTHTSAPEDLLLELETSLDTSNSELRLQGQTILKLRPIIHTLTALYPLPAHYQSISGTFSGNWTEAINKQPSPTSSTIGPIQGKFSLDAKVPTWPPFAQDIQLQTKGTIAITDGQAKMSIQPTSSGSVILAMDSFIPPVIDAFIRHDNRRSVAWKILEPIQVEAPIKQKVETMKISSGNVHMAVNNASEQLDILLSPEWLLWTTTSGVAGKAYVDISTQLKPGPTPTWHPEALLIEANAAMTISPKQIAVSFNPSSYFRFSNMKKESLHVPTLVSRFPQGASATYLLDKRILTVETARSVLSLPSVFLQKKEWELQEIFTKDLTIQNTPTSWAINGDSHIKNVHIPFDSMKIPDSNWQSQYSVNPQSLIASFNGHTLDHPIRIRGQAKLDIENEQAMVALSMQPLLLAPKTRILSQIIQPWPFRDMDVTHGAISASAEVHLVRNPPTAATSFHITRLHGILNLKEIGGFLKPTILEDLTTRVEILGNNDIFHIPAAPLHIRRIQSAVDLTDTSFLLSSGTFQLDSPPSLSVSNVSTHLLGGRVTLSQATYDPLQPTQNLALEVQGIDLNEILLLEQQETVKGTGLLDGHLPLFISGTDIEIHQGSLKVRPPGGIIQMNLSEETAESWAQSQPQLDLIVQSLENFHYSQLDIGVDYDKHGILKLASQLKGKNPEFRNGVPVHFNLNIEEDVPALLESLSLIQNLEDKIGTMMTGEEQSSTKKEK